MRYYHNNSFDYIHTDKSIAEGLDCEIFNFKSLEKAYKNSKTNQKKNTLAFILRIIFLNSKLVKLPQKLTIQK